MIFSSKTRARPFTSLNRETVTKGFCVCVFKPTQHHAIRLRGVPAHGYSRWLQQGPCLTPMARMIGRHAAQRKELESLDRCDSHSRVAQRPPATPWLASHQHERDSHVDGVEALLSEAALLAVRRALRCTLSKRLRGSEGQYYSMLLLIMVIGLPRLCIGNVMGLSALLLAVVSARYH